MKKKKKKKKEEDNLLTRSQKIELAAEIHQLMIDGESDGDIIDQLGITAQHFSIAKKFLLESIGDQQELMSSKERFALYLIQSERNVSDLDDLITNLNGKNQYNLILGAVRMRQEVQNQIISTGQTLGIIAKEPERRLILGGVTISDLPDKELKKGVVKAISGLAEMFEKYGDGTKLSQLSPGNLHYGDAVEVKDSSSTDTAALGAPPMKAPSKDKRNRAKANKRSAGRRRVKE